MLSGPTVVPSISQPLKGLVESNYSTNDSKAEKKNQHTEKKNGVRILLLFLLLLMLLFVLRNELQLKWHNCPYKCEMK